LKIFVTTLNGFLGTHGFPSPEELDVSNTKRPEIRLKFAISGNRDTDLQQYKKTLLEYAADEKQEDFFARALQVARSLDECASRVARR
jgi:hypothetical protein